jgi:hypothetical protein
MAIEQRNVRAIVATSFDAVAGSSCPKAESSARNRTTWSACVRAQLAAGSPPPPRRPVLYRSFVVGYLYRT